MTSTDLSNFIEFLTTSFHGILYLCANSFTVVSSLRPMFAHYFCR
jgi:hypothetical protein